MYFDLSIVIKRSTDDVFAFLRDKDQHQRESDSPVLLLEKTTGGATDIGTGYREIVQMMPFVKGEIISRITRFDPPNALEEEFAGAGMTGYLAYQFIAVSDGTQLVQLQQVNFSGLLKLLHPVMRIMLRKRLTERLQEIKSELEK